MARPIVAAPWNAATVTAARTVAWLRCPLDDVARIRAAFGGTVNDVVLAMLSEGAARYLEYHGCPTEGRPLRIGCPVNVRAKDEYGKLGNRVSMMFPEFDARTMRPSIGSRRSSRRPRGSRPPGEAIAFENLLATLDYVPPAALGLTSRLLTSAIEGAGRLAGTAPRLARRAPMLGTGISFVATNIPGSPVPVYLAGHQLADTVGMIPLTATLGYGVAILSYNGNLYLGLTAEPNLMPDVDFMKSRIKETLRELIARVPKAIVPAAPPAAPRARPRTHRRRLSSRTVVVGCAIGSANPDRAGFYPDAPASSLRGSPPPQVRRCLSCARPSWPACPPDAPGLRSSSAARRTSRR